MLKRMDIYMKILILQLALLFVMPSLDKVDTHIGIFFYGIFGVLSVIFILFYIKNGEKNFGLCNIFVIVFFAICFISGIYGCIIGNTVGSFIRGLLPFCWYSYILVLSSNRYRSIYGTIITFIGIIASLYSVRLIIYYVIFVLLGDSSRVTLNLSSATSVVTMIGVLIFIYLFIFYKDRFNKIYYMGIILCYLSMCLTITKSMIVATIFGVLVFLALCAHLLVKSKNKLKEITTKNIIINISIVIITLVIVTMTVYTTTNMADRWKSAAEAVTSENVASETIDGSVAPRLIEYSVAYSNWKDSPILGKGLGYKWSSEKLPYANEIIFMHNIIAYLLLDFGLIGVIFIAIIIIFIIVAFVRINRNSKELGLKNSGAIILAFSVLIMMFIYANFFAVFRNIDFTIMCAIFISILASFSDKKVS